MTTISSSFVLSATEQKQLQQLVRKGTAPARQLNRARIQQFTHQGPVAPAIRHLLGVSEAKVYNVRRRYRDGGLAAALPERPRPGQPRKVTPAVEAAITESIKVWGNKLLAAVTCLPTTTKATHPNDCLTCCPTLFDALLFGPTVCLSLTKRESQPPSRVGKSGLAYSAVAGLGATCVPAFR